MPPPKTKAPPQRLRIALSKLEAMPGNREFGSGSGKPLTELAASIKQHGVKQDLLVRPHPTKKGHFQIVFGCRRRDASEIAKIPDAPCTVEELTDAEALELRVIENLQRAGLHEMEEARGYQELLDLRDDKGAPVHTRASIAEKIDKSEAYVYARLKLLRMPDVAQEAFLKGKLNASVALLLCRIPNEKVAYKATLEVLDRYGSGITPDREKRALDPEQEPMSYRSAKSHIQNKYMIRLKGAKFDQEDETLVPVVYEPLPVGRDSVEPAKVVETGKPVDDAKAREAARNAPPAHGERICGGKCSDCPYRTGNLKKLAPDVVAMAEGGADVCTNTACYQLKVKATLKREQAKYKDKGQTLLTAGQARKVLNYEGTELAATDEYIDLRATVPGKKKTYEELLEPHLPEDATPIVARGKKSFLLLPIADALDAAKKAGIKLDKPAPREHQVSYQEEQAKQAKRKAFSTLVVNAAMAKLDEAVKSAQHSALIRELIGTDLLCRFSRDRDADPKKIRAAVKKMSDPELFTALFEQGIFQHRLVNWQGEIDEAVGEVCGEFGIDLKAITKAVGEEAKAEAAKAKEAKPEPEKAAEAKK